MTRRAWICVSIAYLLLVIGIGSALWGIQRQTNRLDKQTDFLVQQAAELRIAAGIFCETAKRTEKQEVLTIELIADGYPIEISPVCRRLSREVFSEED